MAKCVATLRCDDSLINVFRYSPDKLKLHNSTHVDCSVLVSSQVCSRFIRRSSGNVTRVKAGQSPLSPPDLAAQLQVEQGQKEAKSAGGGKSRVGDFAAWTDQTLRWRKPPQSDGLWCRGGASSWFCSRLSRLRSWCWPAAGQRPECHQHHHRHYIIISKLWSSFPLKKNLSQSKDANTEDVDCNKRLRTSRLQIFFFTLWISKICY